MPTISVEKKTPFEVIHGLTGDWFDTDVLLEILGEHGYAIGPVGQQETKMPDTDFTPGLDALHDRRMADQELARKIEAPLPQRVKNIDTGELMDAYSLHLTMDERRRLIDALRR